jgi:tetratricopeptide (TPR) repeat protein
MSIRTSITRSLALLSLFSVLLTPLAAADTKITVKCATEAGEAMSGVQVFAAEVRTGKVLDRKTNKQGIVEFKKLDPGVYRVIARAQGFAPAYKDIFPVRPGEEQTVQLTFHPGDAMKKMYWEDEALGQQVAQLFQEAIDLLQQNKLPEAGAKLEQAIEINPTIPGARQNLAVVYLHQEKWDEAQEQLNTAIQNVNDLKQIEEVSGGDTSGHDNMIAELQKVIDTIPALKVQVRANKALEEGNNEEAVTLLQELTEITPEDGNAFYNLALAQAKLKRYEDSKQTIDKAAALNPEDKNIQELKRLLGENEKALAMQEVQKIVVEGDEAFNAGNYQEAVAKYEEAKADAPPEMHADIWRGLARGYQQLKQNEKAVEAFQKAIELNPEKAQFSQELADLYFSQDQTSEGVQALTMAYKQGDKPMDEALFAAGAAYRKKRDGNKAATALFEETLKVNANHPEAHYELGMLYFYEQGDRARAKTMLEKYTALGKDPGHLDSAKAVLVVIEKTPAPKPAAGGTPKR